MGAETFDLETDDRGVEQENCSAINEAEQAAPRASFNGLLKDAPGCATMVANALSQQAIHEVNPLLGEATGQASDLLVSFDTLDVSLGSAAYPYVQPPALEALKRAIGDRSPKTQEPQALLVYPSLETTSFSRPAAPANTPTKMPSIKVLSATAHSPIG